MQSVDSYKNAISKNSQYSNQKVGFLTIIPNKQKLQIFSGVVWLTRDLHLPISTLYLLSPRLCFFIVVHHDLIVYRDDSLTS